MSKLMRIMIAAGVIVALLGALSGAAPAVTAQAPGTFQKVWAFELTDEGGQGISFINRSPFANTVTVKVYDPDGGGTPNMTKTVSLVGYETKTVFPGLATDSGGWGLAKMAAHSGPTTDRAYGMIATASEFFSVMLYPDELLSGYGSGKTAIWAQNVVTDAWWGHYNYPAEDCNTNGREYFFVTNPGDSTATLSISLYKSNGDPLGSNPRPDITVSSKQTKVIFLEADLSSSPGTNCDNKGYPGEYQNIGVNLSSDVPVNVSIYTTLGTAWDDPNQRWGSHEVTGGVYVAYENACMPTKWSWVDAKNGDGQTAARVTNPNDHAITVRETWYTTDGSPASYQMDTTILAHGTAELPAPTPFDPGYKNETVNGKYRLFRTVESVGDQGNTVAGFHVHVSYDANIDLPAPHRTDWWWGSYSPTTTDELFFINTDTSNLSINVEYAEGGSALHAGETGGTPIVLPPNAPPGRALEWQISSDYLAPMTEPSIATAGTDGKDFTLHYFSDTAFPLHLEWTASGAYGDLLPLDCGTGAGDDYGDNPDTGTGTGTGNYKTLNQDNGPHHTVSPKLYLGPTVDFDSDGQPTTSANGDDADTTPNDEDGVDPGELTLVPGSSCSVDVTVFNSTGSTAYLVGWIDFNGNGQFEDGERATQTVSSTGSSQTVTLHCGTVPLDAVSTTYARFRVGLDQTKTQLSTGWAGVGEVEDYAVTVLGAIGDYVWNDSGALVGEQDQYDDPGINDVEMELWLDDGDGVFESGEDTKQTTMLTQNDGSGKPGWYLFTGLDAGTYFVRINPAEFDSGGTLYEYSPTVPDVDSNTKDAVDSDGDNPDCPYNHTAGEPSCGSQSTWEDNILAKTTLDSGEQDLTIDFGVVYTGPPTAVTLSSLAAKSSAGSANWLWLGLAGVTMLAAGSTFWKKRRAD